MDDFSAAVIVKALDGLTARQIATAENIANANTVNYRPLRVSFEQALEAAARAGDVSLVKPSLEQASPGAYGGDLRVDLELQTASSTAMRYAALIELMNREMQIEDAAIKGAGPS